MQKQSKKTARGLRLRQEARNCLALAVQKDDEDYVARLIDESITLARRSRELLDAAD